jgi:hypothetical protein
MMTYHPCEKAPTAYKDENRDRVFAKWEERYMDPNGKKTTVSWALLSKTISRFILDLIIIFGTPLTTRSSSRSQRSNLMVMCLLVTWLQ